MQLAKLALSEGPMDRTGEGRSEWALETLLRDEKISVRQLEERNRALRENVYNLEHMISVKTPPNFSDDTSSKYSR